MAAPFSRCEQSLFFRTWISIVALSPGKIVNRKWYFSLGHRQGSQPTRKYLFRSSESKVEYQFNRAVSVTHALAPTVTQRPPDNTPHKNSFRPKLALASIVLGTRVSTLTS